MSWSGMPAMYNVFELLLEEHADKKTKVLNGITQIQANLINFIQRLVLMMRLPPPAGH